MTCAVVDCPTPVNSRDWCEKHYRRWLRYGDPLTVLSPTGSGLPATPPVPDLGWAAAAACSPGRLPEGTSSDDFFAGVGGGRGSRPGSVVEAEQRAIAACRTCPVIVECRETIQTFNKVDRFGVWAAHAYSQHDRRGQAA